MNSDLIPPRIAAAHGGVRESLGARKKEWRKLKAAAGAHASNSFFDFLLSETIVEGRRSKDADEERLRSTSPVLQLIESV